MSHLPLQSLYELYLCGSDSKMKLGLVYPNPWKVNVVFM